VADVLEKQDVAYKESAAQVEANFLLRVQPERRQHQDDEHYKKKSEYFSNESCKQNILHNQANVMFVVVLFSLSSLCFGITRPLTYGAEPFMRGCQLCSHSRTSQQF
jgi:hypothetical protein